MHVRTGWFALVVALLGLLGSSVRHAVGAESSARPNILLLLADDQRPDTIAALGNRHIRTPTLDKLVARGTVFRQAHIMGGMQGAICVPSRATLMTGRTLFRVNEKLPSEPLLPAVLQAAGYSTFGCGKWHNGPAAFARAFAAGDNIFFGGMSDQNKITLYHFDPDGKYPKTASFVGNGYSTELIADAAIEFLKRPHDRPFFCYVPFTSPHDPRTPPGEFATMYSPGSMALPENFLPEHPFDNGELKVRDEMLAPFPRTADDTRRQLADYYGMISHLDAQIARILATLDERQLTQNTMVIFAADNGLAIGSHGLFGKQNLYEHSMGVPLVVAGPGVQVGKQNRALCYLLDLFPTLCQLAGASLPDGVEGKSLVDVLQGKSTTHRSELFAAYRLVQRSIRVGDWKLIYYPQVGQTQLFDLAGDPSELKNLAEVSSLRERREQLERRLADVERELNDPLVAKSN